jgi:hypothetical protein
MSRVRFSPPAPTISITYLVWPSDGGLKAADDSLTFDPDEMGKAAVVLASDDSSRVAGVARFAGGGQSPVGSGRRAGDAGSVPRVVGQVAG